MKLENLLFAKSEVYSMYDGMANKYLLICVVMIFIWMP